MITQPYHNYKGSKDGSGVYQAIINQIPSHIVYIEAFLGNGAIFKHKKLAQTSILIDINPKIIEDWRAVNSFDYDMIHLMNIDALQYLNQLLIGEAFKDDPENVFIYLDPPYVMTSRSCKRDIYKYEMTEEQHRQLLKMIKQLPFKVAISCYPDDLYDRSLTDWRRIVFRTQIRNGPAIEILYMNYPEPEKLHDYSFIGKDFRERERIRQKIKRHVNGLLRLPIHERNAILEAINKH